MTSTSPPLRVGLVVLAAGEGSRFSGPTHKLLAPVRGRPLVVHAVDSALNADVGPVIVVAGALDLTDVLVGADLAHRVTLVDNPRWAEGQATSLAAGIAAVDALGVDSAVVGLGDQPAVPAAAWRAVATAPASPIVVATYGGRRRNPVRLARSVWPDLPTAGDEGARSLIAGRPDLVIEIACPGEPDDIDTLEDLDRWS